MTVSETRYERILSRSSAGLARAMARAGGRTRGAIEVSSVRERCIRDVATGVAGPALIAYTAWLASQAREFGGRRIFFLSRDGQLLYLLASQLAEALSCKAELSYLYASRRIWNLAGASGASLPAQRWLFESFMPPNAADLCRQLGLHIEECLVPLKASGVSLDPKLRSDHPSQSKAMQRFLNEPAISKKVAGRVEAVRSTTVAYLRQEGVLSHDSVLVDAGWTGRMVGSLAKTLNDTGFSMPSVLFWGYQPKNGVPEPRVAIRPYMYDTSREARPRWKLPDITFLIESFLMANHGITADYKLSSSGRVDPVLDSSDNPTAERWGLGLYRRTLMKLCEVLAEEECWYGDLRSTVHDLLGAFWLHPTALEAQVWGAYLYDSDPTGSAARPLARSFSLAEIQRGLQAGRLERGDRAWLQGSLVLTSTVAQERLAGLPDP